MMELRDIKRNRQDMVGEMVEIVNTLGENYKTDVAYDAAAITRDPDKVFFWGVYQNGTRITNDPAHLRWMQKFHERNDIPVKWFRIRPDMNSIQEVIL